MKSAAILIVLLLFSSVSFAQTSGKRSKVVAALINSSHRLNFAVTAVRLRSGFNTERAYSDLDTLLAREYGDMFWMYGMAGLYHSTKEILPDAVKIRVREAWRLRTPYRGDTENHFLMYYGSLFLMSEVWPNLAGSEWFTGQSSREIRAQSKEYLVRWMYDVARHGQGEFDSPRYQYYFYTPLVLLSQYAQDPEVKQLSSMTLELLLADYAIKYMNGNYAGAHSRTMDAAVLTGHIGETGSYGEYFFEESVTNVQPDLGFVALTEYQCPEIVRNIAKNKSAAFVLEETKQPRKQLRYRKDSVITKYTYVGDGFALGSLQHGVVQPIQQQTWKLVFDSKASPNTITGLHPFVSSHELATFFPEEPSFLAERIESTKAGYSSEDKWIGGSPFYHVAQERNVILAAFSIPENITSSHGDLFIPKGATLVDIHRDGDELKAHFWHIFRFDSVFVGIQLSKPMRWIDVENGIRLRRGREGGYVIVVDRAKDAATFLSRIKGKTIRQKGSAYSFTMGNIQLKLDTKGRKSLPSKWLYRSPYINSVRGSAVITLSFGQEKRVLDFIFREVRQE